MKQDEVNYKGFVSKALYQFTSLDCMSLIKIFWQEIFNYISGLSEKTASGTTKSDPMSLLKQTCSVGVILQGVSL